MTARILQTSRYSPGNLAPEVLERLLVGRSDLLNEILRKTSKSIRSSSKQHILIVGPRGAGKTHLVALLNQRLATDPSLAYEREHSIVAYLNEEEWGVASFLDLVLTILRSLQDSDGEIAARISVIENTFEHDPEEARNIAEETLRNKVGGKTLVLLCENLHDLFEGLGHEGQARWRALVQEQRFWCIVATAPALFLAVSRQTEPFYGFFTIRNLERLSLEDAIELLRRKAELEGRDALAKAVDSPIGRARVRAIHHIAGGNHRAYIVLSEFLTKESLDDLVVPFMNMVDDLTPYYQERMRNLTSPLQRKLVDYLCRQRKPSPVKDIARATLVQPQSAAKQLGELARLAIVQKTPRGRESYYELSEPLMRICIEVKDNRTEYIRTFIDLLRHWFSSRELEARHEHGDPSRGGLDRSHLWAALQDNRANKTDPFLEALGLEASRCEKEGDLSGLVEAAGRRADELGQLTDYITVIQASWDLEQFPDVEERARRALAIYPDEIGFRTMLAKSLFMQDKYEAAIAECDEVIRRDRNRVSAWCFRGDALYRLKRYKEAVENEDALLRIDPGHTHSYEIRALALVGMNRRNEAEQMLIELVNRWPSRSLCRALIELLLEARKNSEGIEYCELMLKNSPDDNYALCRKGIFLERLGRLEEAVEIERHLLRVDPDHTHSYANLADGLMRLGRYDEALDSSKELVARAPNEVEGWRLHLRILMAHGLFREAELALQEIKRLSEEIDPEVLMLEVRVRGALSQWLAAVASAEAIASRGDTPDAKFALAWALLGSGQELTQVQTKALCIAATGVSEIWLVDAARMLRDTYHADTLAELLNSVPERVANNIELLYEQGMRSMDKGKLDEVTANAARLKTLGALEQADALTVLVKAAREGIVSALRDIAAQIDTDRDGILSVNILLASLWNELEHRGPISFANQTVAIYGELPAAKNILVSEALLSLLRRIVRTRPSFSGSAGWDAAFETLSSLPRMDLLLQLFRVGVRFAATNDEGVLLELPLEQRKLIEYEAGESNAMSVTHVSVRPTAS